MSGSTGRRKRRAFWVRRPRHWQCRHSTDTGIPFLQTIWILHSFLFTALFGYLHQAGLVPSLLALNDSLRSPGMPFLSLPPTTASPPAEIELVFWKTFMPPRHLVLPLTSSSLPFSSRAVISLTTSPPLSHRSQPNLPNHHPHLRHLILHPPHKPSRRPPPSSFKRSNSPPHRTGLRHARKDQRRFTELENVV